MQYKAQYGGDGGFARAAYNKAMEQTGGRKSRKRLCAGIEPDAACRALMPAVPSCEFSEGLGL